MDLILCSLLQSSSCAWVYKKEIFHTNFFLSSFSFLLSLTNYPSICVKVGSQLKIEALLFLILCRCFPWQIGAREASLMFIVLKFSYDAVVVWQCNPYCLTFVSCSLCTPVPSSEGWAVCLRARDLLGGVFAYALMESIIFWRNLLWGLEQGSSVDRLYNNGSALSSFDLIYHLELQLGQYVPMQHIPGLCADHIWSLTNRVKPCCKHFCCSFILYSL